VPEPRRYRVEFQQGGATQYVGHLDHCYAHHSALDPFVSRLVQEGQAGTVCLIDDETGALVARRRVLPPGMSTRQRPRQGRLSPLLFGIPAEGEAESTASE
jgi:hypothetical protein